MRLGKKKILMIISVLAVTGFILILAWILKRRPEAITEENIYDPLCQTIEEDPSYGDDGIFYISDSEDFLRFSGYLNRAGQGKTRPAFEEAGAVLAIDAVLTADINLNESRYYDLWRESYKRTGIKYPVEVRYIQNYQGNFDGRGHTIILNTYHWTRKGMFRFVERKGTVSNLTVIAPSMVSEEDSPVGIICGYNLGLIQNCSTEGYVEGAGSVGGIAGANYGSIIQCSNEARVVCSAISSDGAGGIAGKLVSGYDREEDRSSPAVSAVIAECCNYGLVEGKWIAGGISSFGAKNGGSAEIRDCRNEGNVTVFYQNAEPLPGWGDWEHTAKAAGICPRIYNRLIVENCSNTGVISIQEEGIGSTYGIGEYEYDFHTFPKNCVSLAGTASGSMRHENIMELSAEEMAVWVKEPDAVPYIPNSWQFDLEEAKERMGLVPLGLTESVLTEGKEDIFLCDEFYFRVPEGFVIREVSPYALCAEAVSSSFPVKKAQRGYQVWLLRLPKDAAKGNVSEADIRESGQGKELQLDLEGVCGSIEGYYELHPGQINSTQDSSLEKRTSGQFINHAKTMQSEQEYLYNGKVVDNVFSLPVKDVPDKGYEMKWLLLFTDRESNYCPEWEFIEAVQDGFLFLPRYICIRAGDTLYSIAKYYTGNGARYTELMEYNGLSKDSVILIGQQLKLPEEWVVEQP